MHRIIGLALIMGSIATASGAQSGASRPDPTNAAAAITLHKYDSPFAGYKPFREEKLEEWRALNEETARAGGHVGIFGGAGEHAGHGAAKSAQGKPAPMKPEAAAEGQPLVRGAPKAPAAAAHHQDKK